MPTPTPIPVPPSASVLKFPQDHYAHADAPTEWYWHTGTLRAGDRTFGFEINAAHFGVLAGFIPFYFTQVMLTDVANDAHYQQSAFQLPLSQWAETDPSKDWYAHLGDSDFDPTALSGWINMSTPNSGVTHDPTQNMQVKAALYDTASKTIVKFDLTLSQQGPPLIVWGTGVTAQPVPPDPSTNNYYYSLTRLQASGTVTIGTEVIPVTGLTWMDHEYGLFGSSAKPIKWFLQDMQLSNGVHISNSVSFPDAPPTSGVPAPSIATLQFPDGTLYFQTDCTVTPGKNTWTNPDTKATFFTDFVVNIPGFEANLTVTSLTDAQDFPFPFGLADTYEGVAKAEGTFQGQQVYGTAWNEQQP